MTPQARQGRQGVANRQRQGVKVSGGGHAREASLCKGTVLGTATHNRPSQRTAVQAGSHAGRPHASLSSTCAPSDSASTRRQAGQVAWYRHLVPSASRINEE